MTIFSLAIANWELNIEYSTLAVARLKFDRGDYSGAISLYNLEIEVNGRDAESIFQRGKCQQFLGNYSQAIQDYNQSLSIDPDRAEVYYMLGLLHDLFGRQSLAMFNYCRTISLDPHHAEALVSRSFAYYHLDSTDAVIPDLRAALNIFLDRGNNDRAKDIVESIALLSSLTSFNVPLKNLPESSHA